MRRFIWLAVIFVGCTGVQEVASTSTLPSTSSSAALQPTTTSIPTPTTEPATTTTATTLPPLVSLEYEKVGDFDFPVQVIPGAEVGLLYVVDKVGIVYVVEGGVVLDDPLLDINGRVRSNSEQGLLAVALHPEDQTRLFVHYSDNGRDTVVSEFRLDSPVRGRSR